MELMGANGYIDTALAYSHRRRRTGVDTGNVQCARCPRTLPMNSSCDETEGTKNEQAAGCAVSVHSDIQPIVRARRLALLL